MADEVELTNTQTEKLLLFQDLTSIDDLDRCRVLLEEHNWDIEVAVQDTLSIQEGSPSVFHPPSERAPPVVDNAIDQRLFRPLPPPATSPGLLGWSYLILTFPLRMLYNTLLGLLNFAFRLVRPDPIRSVTDPLGDVISFINDFDVRYGPNHPVFYQGTYSQVLNDAKRELKFLLVYLHSEDHQDTPEFCRGTLCSPEVTQFINTRILFWGCSVNTPEGYRVSQALRENGYPFLAVIVLRENRMTVVARMEGMAKPAQLITRLEQVMEENEMSLIAARAERHERNLNQTIRRQQDEAYLESLKADQEKERIRREVQEVQEREEQERRDEELARQRRTEEIHRLKIELVDQVPEEPPSSHPDCIRIVIKFPDGTRLERRFLKSHSMKVLYYFVFCHDLSPSNFQVVTNFPRRVLHCEPTKDDPEPASFANAGLGPMEMLFVHDLDA